MSETHSTLAKQVATAQGGPPYGGPVAERWRLLRGLVRIVGYVFLVTTVLAMRLALAAGIAKTMEVLLGWPDTWAL